MSDNVTLWLNSYSRFNFIRRFFNYKSLIENPPYKVEMAVITTCSCTFLQNWNHRNICTVPMHKSVVPDWMPEHKEITYVSSMQSVTIFTSLLITQKANIITFRHSIKTLKPQTCALEQVQIFMWFQFCEKVQLQVVVKNWPYCHIVTTQYRCIWGLS